MTPSPTHWNSTYDAVKRVQELRDEDRVAFSAILAAADLPSMTVQEMAFIDEWTQVMRHVAGALDLLQGEEGIFLALEKVLAYCRLKKMLMKCNCILPGSASSERLFSKAKLVLRRTRHRIGDRPLRLSCYCQPTRPFSSATYVYKNESVSLVL